MLALQGHCQKQCNAVSGACPHLARARGFEMQLDGMSCHVLLPLIDLFAAPGSGEESHAAVALDDNEDVLRITAGREISKGEQLTLSL